MPTPTKPTIYTDPGGSLSATVTLLKRAALGHGVVSVETSYCDCPRRVQMIVRDNLGKIVYIGTSAKPLFGNVSESYILTPEPSFANLEPIIEFPYEFTAETDWTVEVRMEAPGPLGPDDKVLDLVLIVYE